MTEEEDDKAVDKLIEILDNLTEDEIETAIDVAEMLEADE